MSCAFILSRQLEAHVRACVCVDSWWTVQGSGETLGEDSNTHTHTLTRIHSHTLIIPAHTRNTHLEAEDAPEDAQRSLIICASSFFFLFFSQQQEKEKSFQTERKRRGEECRSSLSTQRQTGAPGNNSIFLPWFDIFLEITRLVVLLRDLFICGLFFFFIYFFCTNWHPRLCVDKQSSKRRKRRRKAGPGRTKGGQKLTR